MKLAIIPPELIFLFFKSEVNSEGMSNYTLFNLIYRGI